MKKIISLLLMVIVLSNMNYALDNTIPHVITNKQFTIYLGTSSKEVISETGSQRASYNYENVVITILDVTDHPTNSDYWNIKYKVSGRCWVYKNTPWKGSLDNRLYINGSSLYGYYTADYSKDGTRHYGTTFTYNNQEVISMIRKNDEMKLDLMWSCTGYAEETYANERADATYSYKTI